MYAGAESHAYTKASMCRRPSPQYTEQPQLSGTPRAPQVVGGTALEKTPLRRLPLAEPQLSFPVALASSYTRHSASRAASAARPELLDLQGLVAALARLNVETEDQRILSAARTKQLHLGKGRGADADPRGIGCGMLLRPVDEAVLCVLGVLPIEATLGSQEYGQDVVELEDRIQYWKAAAVGRLKVRTP
ncbi:uncharacterized protein PG986_013099 [Apiospora aurea]|uniref:Uncharacterized protein n=1 Tax=Apiospora aurea TaxID=335848 RepID=A0ABR1Q325_9PEZI